MPAKKTKKKATGFTIRHYCQGIGDCHLLRFTKKDGKPLWMLIDCGIHTSISGGPAIIDDIVADIAVTTGGKIDILVLTHEHTDHISAFIPSAGRFSAITVGEVWMAWTESDKDPQAKNLDKFKELALSALTSASRQLRAYPGIDGATVLREGIDGLLAFSFGIKGERVREMRDAAGGLATAGVRYLEPAQAPLEMSNVPGVRVFVLAPSRDESYLKIVDRIGERYRMASDEEGLRIADTLTSALATTSVGSDAEDLNAPFDTCFGTSLSELARRGKSQTADPLASFAEARYFGACERSPQVQSTVRVKPDANETDQQWRRIDHDWLSSAGALAMQLDSKTNNTSLVLAFELVDTGRVFLFAADAQIGNWLSWEKAAWQMPDGSVITGPDLLERTVYYKVGHHGSENATAKAKGLELMTSEDLSAFIPTNEVDAKKVKWGEMPFHSILTELDTRCGKRIVRADDPRLLARKAPFATPSGSIRAMRIGAVGTEKDQRRTYVEFDVA